MNVISATNLIYKEDLSAKAKTVFMYLAYRSNKDNTCFPGLQRIAKECSISISTVQRAIRELLKAQLIKKQPNYRANGSQTSNLYTMLSHASTCTTNDTRKKREHSEENQMKMDITPADSADIVTEKLEAVETDILPGQVPEKKVCKRIKKSKCVRRKLWEHQLIGKKLKMSRNETVKLKMTPLSKKTHRLPVKMINVFPQLLGRIKSIFEKRLEFQCLTRGGSHNDQPRTKTD